MPDVVVAGHICLDIIPEIPPSAGPLDPGKLLEVGPAVLSTGGAVSNVGIALHKLGLSVRLVGKVGGDALGQIVLDILESEGEGLSKGMAVAPGEATSYSIVVSRPGQDRTFLHFPGANDTFAAADVPDEALEGALIFHFGYPPIMRRFYEDGGEQLRTLLSRARERGLVTSLDMSLPDPNSDAGHADWDALLARALPTTDLFLPSIEELSFMLRRSVSVSLSEDSQPDLATIEALADRCLQFGAKVVALKCGVKGIYLRTADSDPLFGLESWRSRQMWMPTWDVPVMGTTGSGDATVAGFLSCLALGPEAALRGASLVGALCVQKADAVSGIVSLTEENEMMTARSLRSFPFPEEGHGWKGEGPRLGPIDRKP